jgi:hypothetical protein
MFCNAVCFSYLYDDALRREQLRPKTAGEIGDVANGRIVHSIDDFHPAGIVNTIKSFALLGMPPGEGLIE